MSDADMAMGSSFLNDCPGIALHGTSRGVPGMGAGPEDTGVTPPTAALRLRESENPARRCPSPPSPKPGPGPAANPGVVGRAEGGGANDDAWRKNMVSCVAWVTRWAVPRRDGEIGYALD
ncbi:hypothetical protein RSAG8_00221, partial [Rhizoctonia solani AG-8 WAC10335]